MPSIEEALAAVHAKETAIRVACADFDLAFSSLRQHLQLSSSQGTWMASFSSRIIFMNKQYRVNVKNDLQALSTRLRQTYGKMNVAGPMAHLQTRSKEALDYYNETRALLAEFRDLYDTCVRNKSLNVVTRVTLSRAMPRFQEGIEHATLYARTIEQDMKEWDAYIGLLSCEAKLSEFLETMHQHKLTKAIVNERTMPVFDHILEVYNERNSIVAETNALGLAHEAAWLAKGENGIREREFRREIEKYNVLLDRALAQKPAQAAALVKAEELVALAQTPESITGPGGVQITLSRLRDAYSKYQAILTACDTVCELLKPATDLLRSYMRKVREGEQFAVSAAMQAA